MFFDQKTDPLIEALREKVTITPGFEKEIPPYLSDFLYKNVGELQVAIHDGDNPRLTRLLSELCQSLPKDTPADSFKELFATVFVPKTGKPHLAIVKGEHDLVNSSQVRSADLDFPEAPVDTENLLIIHTHPFDSAIGLSQEDKDAFSVQFNKRLKLFPDLKRAYIGLVTAKRPEQVLVFETKDTGPSWGNVKYFEFP